MNNTRIEGWTLGIVDRLKLGHPIEDTRVELKRTWPPADKAARRLADHANAAGGEPVLWVVGLDEGNQSVVGVDEGGFDTWWPAVAAQFDELPPVVRELNVPVDRVTVVALHVQTDRAPYVVRNPLFGQQSGGPIEREVPWREGTHVRSARRSDLIRMLLPSVAVPVPEVHSCLLERVIPRPVDGVGWFYRMVADLYIRIPAGSEPLIVPDHDVHVTATFSENGGCWLRNAYLDEIEERRPQWLPLHESKNANRTPLIVGTAAHTAQRGHRQLVISGSAPIRVMAESRIEAGPSEVDLHGAAAVHVEFMADGAIRPVVLDIECGLPVKEDDGSKTVYRWTMPSC